MDDRKLSTLLSEIDPSGLDILRRLMRAGQSERDEFAAALMRQRSAVADDLAELLDGASLNPGVRRQVVRVIGELSARS